jgi:hypothetical protein
MVSPLIGGIEARTEHASEVVGEECFQVVNNEEQSM